MGTSISYSSRLLLGAALYCFVFSLSLPSRAHAEEEEDYYKLLGVAKTASEREIKKAFRKLAMDYHPDKNPDPQSRKKFEKIANAYDILSDKDKRREYDMFGPQGAAQQDTPFDFDAFFRPGGDSGFHHHAHFNFHSMFDDFFDDDFFNNGFGDFFHESHRQAHHHHHQHADENGFFGFDMEDRHARDDDDLFGDAFGDFFGGGFEFETHTTSQGHRGQRCQTVTKRVGNTVTTQTTCT